MLPATSQNRVGEGMRVGIGSDIGRLSMIGLAQPPALLSNPLRLNMIFIVMSAKYPLITRYGD
jgi:hypothetical protein